MFGAMQGRPHAQEERRRARSGGDLQACSDRKAAKGSVAGKLRSPRTETRKPRRPVKRAAAPAAGLANDDLKQILRHRPQARAGAERQGIFRFADIAALSKATWSDWIGTRPCRPPASATIGSGRQRRSRERERNNVTTVRWSRQAANREGIVRCLLHVSFNRSRLKETRSKPKCCSGPCAPHQERGRCRRADGLKTGLSTKMAKAESRRKRDRGPDHFTLLQACEEAGAEFRASVSMSGFRLPATAACV